MTLKQKKIMRDDILPSLRKISDRIVNEIEYPWDESRGVVGIGAKEFHEGEEYFYKAMGMWTKLVEAKK